MKPSAPPGPIGADQRLVSPPPSARDSDLAGIQDFIILRMRPPRFILLRVEVLIEAKSALPCQELR
ncbi:MAG: hypothetical protein L6R40_008354 [Gallowayella cf. fulva]|nr:MAG: hypothetical protein L6R40_008354 [Xanthomendoza cf. fulva]